MRSDALEKRPGQRRGVSMHLDLEMTKKELEKKVLELEQRITELQAQMLTLALRTPTYVTVPAVQPLTIGPNLPTYYPYIGDTCGTANTPKCTSQSQQNFS